MEPASMVSGESAAIATCVGFTMVAFVNPVVGSVLIEPLRQKLSPACEQIQFDGVCKPRIGEIVNPAQEPGYRGGYHGASIALAKNQ
jgi:hypothetical protein